LPPTIHDELNIYGSMFFALKELDHTKKCYNLFTIKRFVAGFYYFIDFFNKDRLISEIDKILSTYHKTWTAPIVTIPPEIQQENV